MIKQDKKGKHSSNKSLFSRKKDRQVQTSRQNRQPGPGHVPRKFVEKPEIERVVLEQYLHLFHSTRHWVSSARRKLWATRLRKKIKKQSAAKYLPSHFVGDLRNPYDMRKTDLALSWGLEEPGVELRVETKCRLKSAGASWGKGAGSENKQLNIITI